MGAAPGRYAPAMPSAELILEVQGLRKVYRRGWMPRPGGRVGQAAVDGVDLAVGRGSVFGLLGPNGAGKTTLVKILLGLVRGHEGEARIFGRPAGDPSARLRVGFLPEAHRLPGYLTGWQVMRIFGMLAGRTRREVMERAPALLERVGMLADAGRKVREYSKGMQQRLGLAQALVHDPELVFLDEPTDGVDPIGRAAIREIVSDLARRGTTVFINSHLLMEVEMICDRVVIMARGRILREGTIADLTPYTGVVRFDLAQMPPDLETLLAGVGGRPTIDRSSFEIAVDERGLNAAIDRLRARGLVIRSISPRKLSLEESFIDLVRGGKA